MSDAFLGEIRWFAFDYAPQYWLPCDGRSLSVSAYAALYALLGVTYGGNGTTTFNLPDLRGRTLVGVNSANADYKAGTAAGLEAVALSVAQMPPHGHDFHANTAVGTTPSPSGSTLASTGTNAQATTAPLVYGAISGVGVALNPANITQTGSGAAHNNMQPFLALTPCMAAQGVWPLKP